MPGILYHLYFAQEVYQELVPIITLNKINFMAGNLIPDLAVDKQNSHYRKKASIDIFFVPEMKLVKNDLLTLEDPIKFGMYCHLYLDYHFIEKFLINGFIWDIENKNVTNPKNNKSWDTDSFFSDLGLYGAYTEINHLLIKEKKIDIKILEKIPDILPNSGLSTFDIRREKTWKSELNEYLVQKKEYTGNVFNYENLCNFMKQLAKQLVKECIS